MAWTKERHELALESDDALCRLRDSMHKHPADAHETYFTANGENYRIRIERIPSDGRKGIPSAGN